MLKSLFWEMVPDGYERYAINVSEIYILDWYHLHRKVCDTFRQTFPVEKELRKKLRRTITGCLWKGQKEEALEKLKELYLHLLSEGNQELLSQRNGLEELIAYIESNGKEL